MLPENFRPGFRIGYSPPQPMPPKPLALHPRVMTAADLPAAVRLNTIAGWNQTALDWQRFLRHSPTGCFVIEIEGQVVGTVATIPYENFAWIGMVLVDPVFRNLGIGTQLLHRAIEHLDCLGISSLKLDATPLGKPLYAKLGFVTEYEIERWILKRPSPPASAQTAAHPAALDEAQLTELCDRDRPVFGADRGFLLRSLHSDAPDLTTVVSGREALQGYAFGRKGLFADHLGPCISLDATAAPHLLHSFLRQSSRETILVDCLPSHRAFLDSVRAAGFAFSRPLTRMVRGPNAYPGEPASICAILGPEFG
ncbi:MAG TPA: GNAT family N-acetyltransferase [Candidatus Acidoferrales bacterium]|nr:GNAT family N-acetyltransferase [Candidatus Acidoferrales bacterium]